MGTLGLGIAAGTLVGNSIGENKMFNAKMYIVLSVGLTTGISLFAGIILILFRHFFTLVFTKDQEVMEIMEILMCLLVLETIFDTNQGVLTRILIAMGKQKLASIANLVGYYILMIPIGTITTFVLGLGIYGIWIGLIFTGIGAVTGFLIIIYIAD
jgi:MATE family multidrug resistance protein